MRELIRKILKEQVSYSNFCLPIKGWSGKLKANQKFRGVRTKHNGVDLGIDSGSNLYAPEDGKIAKAVFFPPKGQSGYNDCGGYIRIKHTNGIETKYCHLKRIDVEEGEDVLRGQVIGLIGGDSAKNSPSGVDDKGRGNSSHSHLHYEVLADSGKNSQINPEPDFLRNGECGDPIDKDIIAIDDVDPIDNDPIDNNKENKYHDGHQPDCYGVLSTNEVKMDTLKIMKIYDNGFIIDDNNVVVHELKFAPNSIGNMDKNNVNAKGIERYATQNGLVDGEFGDDISIANGNIWVDCRLNSTVFNHINDNDSIFDETSQ